MGRMDGDLCGDPVALHAILLTGDTLEFKLPLDTSIRTVKKHLEVQTQIPAKYQLLLSDAAVVLDDELLAALSIETGVLEVQVVINSHEAIQDLDASLRQGTQERLDALRCFMRLPCDVELEEETCRSVVKLLADEASWDVRGLALQLLARS